MMCSKPNMRSLYTRLVDVEKTAALRGQDYSYKGRLHFRGCKIEMDQHISSQNYTGSAVSAFKSAQHFWSSSQIIAALPIQPTHCEGGHDRGVGKLCLPRRHYWRSGWGHLGTLHFWRVPKSESMARNLGG